MLNDEGGETFGRLVHDETIRVGHESATDRQPLLFATG
jgi:hypothetical protein